MENGFKVGDLVKLKSGSPVLTITSEDKYEVTFIYFNPITGLISRGGCPITSLVKVDE